MRQTHVRNAKRDDADLAGLIIFIVLAVVFIFVGIPYLVAHPFAAAVFVVFVIIVSICSLSAAMLSSQISRDEGE